MQAALSNVNIAEILQTNKNQEGELLVYIFGELYKFF